MMRTQRAFTIIELLVVLAIILAMVGLVVVAVRPARANAVRTECAAKLRNIYGLSQNYLVDERGKLPYAAWHVIAEKKWLSWDDLLMKYVVPGVDEKILEEGELPESIETTAFLCPDDEVSDRRSYAMARTQYTPSSESLGIGATSNTASPPRQFRLSQIDQPAGVLFITEQIFNRNILGHTAAATIDGADGHYPFTDQRVHPEELNYLLLDGHVESLLPEKTIGKGTMAEPEGMWTRKAGD